MTRDDDGSVLLLTVFFGVVLILATAVVVDASAAFLARRSLASQADGAALAAAQSVDLDAYYAGAAADGPLPLGDVDAAVDAYVAAHFPGTAVTGVRTDGTTVAVALAWRLDLPLSPPGYDTVVVTATATARLPVRRP